MSKRYHAPATPAQRLLADPRTPASVSERVAELGATLDPIRLLRRIRVHQQRVVEIADQPAAQRKNTAVPPLERFLAGLRTVQRAVRGFRRELRACERATVRFETAPGYQMQINFGVRRVPVGDAPVAVHLFVATLGYSRRQYARAFADESQRSWFEGMEEAFRHFGGVPATVLMDNARALVSRPRRGSSSAEFHPRLSAFAAHWNFEPRACLPGRARTRGKDERSVGYVKNNAIGGREFASWGALEGHLSAWLREVADRRTHGTTGESPIARFATERTALAPLADRRSFGSPVELARTVSIWRQSR